MDHVLIITALAIVAIVLMVLGQAIGQFDSVLKTVLRPLKDELGPRPVRRVIAPAAVAAVIAALSLFFALLMR